MCGVSISLVTSASALADLPPVSPGGSTQSPGLSGFSERQTLLLLTLMMLPHFALLLVLVPALLGLDPLQDVVVVGQSVAAVVKRAQKRGIPAWINYNVISSFLHQTQVSVVCGCGGTCKLSMKSRCLLTTCRCGRYEGRRGPLPLVWPDKREGGGWGHLGSDHLLESIDGDLRRCWKLKPTSSSPMLSLPASPTSRISDFESSTSMSLMF